jgi:hypothetical protein
MKSDALVHRAYRQKLLWTVVSGGGIAVLTCPTFELRHLQDTPHTDGAIYCVVHVHGSSDLRMICLMSSTSAMHVLVTSVGTVTSVRQTVTHTLVIIYRYACTGNRAFAGYDQDFSSLCTLRNVVRCKSN